MSRTPRLAPWQIWVVDFGQPIGREQGGLRPAVVVGSPVHCRFPIGMALVVPLTSRDRGLDHHVRIDSPESGLNRPSWARTEEITVVSTQRFTRSQPLGIASPAEIATLREWLREMVAFC
ncbi:MAG TPA: type II toxin-antitoxin system PemK/MazF family toxin [Actinophytocola sp.]|uniref:type II toxin-antitoxin system PemK/MazF family toxin n=1 Tax=Actinophytocola sp. TaxID=1872138 RepID=UPI002DDDA69C|nr:type II toxin-antitoxin system PemK/MazF family toxin [Actinophytocola sp.]HEV2782665.1 type II toxin-antitoxin system PemK/MazF family toxin [Actinophytocola sp.]